MSVIDILRKLGVIRYGSKTGTYRNAKDMPAEFLVNGVFNADKELVTKQDIKNAVAAVTESPSGPAKKRGCMPVVLVVTGILGILVVLGIIGSSGDGEKKDVSSGANTGVPDKPALPVVSPLKDWDPQSGEEAAAGPAGLKYDKYVNKKFGFVAELPAHWESQVKDDTALFCGAKGTEEYDATVNFQIINKKPGSTLQGEADEIVSQWKAMNEFKLIQSNTGDLNGNTATYLVASFETPGGNAYQQMQSIIDHEPYYYMISYTAPKNLFRKYYFVMIHLISTFRIAEIPK